MLTWLEINKSAIQYNLRQFRRLVGPKVQIMAVVKSNAYGHGMTEVAKLAVRSGADWLGVINLDEALQLRQAKIQAPILVLSYWIGDKNYSTIRANRRNSKIGMGVKERIDFSIYTYEQARLLSQIAQKTKRSVNIHIKIDTGTSRIGVMPYEAINFIQKIKRFPNLNLRGIFTHHASSESRDQTYTNQQTGVLQKFLNQLKLLKINVPLVHAGCSASTIVNPSTYFNLVRIGIAMYGLWPSGETKTLAKRKGLKLQLKPALKWKTKIIQVKELPAGAFIGYDCTYRTKRKIRLAILPIGYWEGYDRKLSNRGEVLIRGQRCPVRGRVCMNITMVEVTHLSRVAVGDEVILIGRQGGEEVTVEELAKKIDTINYEVTTRINPLILRKYV